MYALKMTTSILNVQTPTNEKGTDFDPTFGLSAKEIGHSLASNFDPKLGCAHSLALHFCLVWFGFFI